MTERVIGFAIDVHKILGPGLLESAYEECLCYELASHRVSFERQAPLAIDYKSVRLDSGYRFDILVVRALLIEVKSVERLIPLHDARLLTCLKLNGIKTGLLLNFNAIRLRDGIKRLVL